jgi:hypothetical protein
MKEIVNVCVNNKLNSDLLTRYASYGINTDALQLFNRLVQQNIQEDEDSSSDEDEE